MAIILLNMAGCFALLPRDKLPTKVDREAACAWLYSYQEAPVPLSNRGIRELRENEEICGVPEYSVHPAER